MIANRRPVLPRSSTEFVPVAALREFRLETVETIPTLILFGLGLSLLLAAAMLSIRGSHPARILLVGLFAVFAFSLIPSLFHSIGRVVSPAALNLGRVMHFALGPLTLLYVRALGGRAPVRGDWLHFAPALVAVALVWSVFPPGPYPHADGHDHRRWLLENPLGWIAGLHIVVYFLVSLGTVFRWRTSATGARRGLLLLLFLYTLGLICGLAGMLIDAAHDLAHLAIAALVPVLALHFLLLMRLPVLIGQVPTEGRDISKKSVPRLPPDEIERVRAELFRLLEIERVYQDEDLSLGGLARELNLTTHQLSYVLNEALGESFYGLVNRYRIEEARDLLLQEPDRTVLSIAMAVGFNSKSSFHSAFTRITGMTPAAFRKQANA